MTREAVASSNIASVAYDSTTATLEVEFRADHMGNRAVWQYADVPEDVWLNFKAAPSLGHALAAIKTTYVGRKVAVIHADGSTVEVAS